MKKLMELAGFMAAHGIWSIAEGPMTPVAAFELPDGSRGLVRFVAETLGAGIEQGRHFLEDNQQGAVMAVMISDDFYTAEHQRLNALMVEGRRYGEEPGGLTVAVPYRPEAGSTPLGILHPELLQFDAVGERFDLLAVFFEGVRSHGPAGEFWREHLDPSFKRVAQPQT